MGRNALLDQRVSTSVTRYTSHNIEEIHHVYTQVMSNGVKSIFCNIHYIRNTVLNVNVIALISFYSKASITLVIDITVTSNR
jgi:hypothetical protein